MSGRADAAEAGPVGGQLRIGVLGAAKIADRSTVPAMLAVEGVTVVGVAARDAARASDFAERHGIPVFDDYDAVIDSDDVDAVYVPLPTSLHAEWALRALRAGKHVLSEKSLAGSLAECLAVLAEARASGLVVLENFMCETHPQNLWIRDAIAGGEIGTVRQLSLSFGFPPFPRDDQRNSVALHGGALNDAGAYCLDMASYYLGATPIAVTAVLGSEDYEVDVVGSALLEYADTVTASVSFGFLHDYRNEARIWGSGGQIDIDRAFSIPPDRVPSVRLTRNTVAEPVELPPANQFLLQIERFRSLVVDGGDAVARELRARERQALAMEAARVSARERRRVELSELG